MVFTGTPIEWIVTIFAVVGLIKLFVIMVNKKSWWALTKNVYGNPGLTGFVSLVLAAVVLWYLLQELTIVQILAAGVFTVLLIGFASSRSSPFFNLSNSLFSSSIFPSISSIFSLFLSFFISFSR